MTGLRRTPPARQNDSFDAVCDAAIYIPFEGLQVQPNGEPRRAADLAATGEQGAGDGRRTLDRKAKILDQTPS